jgi:cytochrome c biogenesis protein CcdA/thiol-disulfide isomerase/thioredoxin
MVLLLGVTVVAGFLTILSPCILPLIPIVLSTGATGGVRRPWGVGLGIVVSFTFAVALLASIVVATGLSAQPLRLAAIGFLFALGIVLLVPRLWEQLERLLARVPRLQGLNSGPDSRGGFASGVVIGVCTGLLCAPCAGPLLTAVATLAATNRVTLGVVAVAAAYAVGLATPLIALGIGGRSLARSLRRTGALVPRVSGVLLVLTAVAMLFGVDQRAQVWAANATTWTGALQTVERLPAVQAQLDKLTGRPPVVAQTSPQEPVATPPDTSQVTSAQPTAPTSTTPEMPRPTTAPATSQATAVPAPIAAAQTSQLTPQTVATPLPKLQPQGGSFAFAGLTNWINSPPLTMSGLRGKVVLVDFWTYSCVNCIRELPHVEAWYEQYASQGFVAVGIHTPEFAFERDPGNVAAAVKALHVTFPVAQDNGFETWNAFLNNAWPAIYLFDANGLLRYNDVGEGDYGVKEAAIRALLAEAGHAPSAAMTNVLDTTPKTFSTTPETYLGSDKLDALASREPPKVGTSVRYSPSRPIPLGGVAFDGAWTLYPEYARADGSASLFLHYVADRVYVVLIPAKAGQTLTVLLDNQPLPDAVAGADVHGGNLVLDQPRLYTVVDMHGVATEHQLTLQIATAGVQAYSFTFG